MCSERACGGEENTILDLGYFRVTLETKIKNNGHKIFVLPKGGD